MAALLTVVSVQFPTPADWMGSWSGLLDLATSLWILGLVLVLPGIWLGMSVRDRRCARAVDDLEPARAEARYPGAGRWAAVLLAVCVLELSTHWGERNGFIASSRPTSGVETWTVADGYATLMDGVIAQADGSFLLPMLKLFLGEAPPQPSEFDRRAGHVYLVSLLARPLNAYWAFAALNLFGWWAAAMAVWWLGLRRWPGTGVPWIASLLVATGQGFLFMAAAPQAHALAFSAFALVLALADALGVWRRTARLGAWLRVGWAAGAAGLVYLVYLPCILTMWLYGAGRARPVGLVTGTVVALAIVVAWQVYGGRLLGLSFSGGNNDLVGEAARGWLSMIRASPAHVVGQLHASSLRGLLAAAFYYPWWALALLGLLASPPQSRRWALAVMIAAALPAIAFTTRFNLPRVAYFMYPALYPLAARGIDWLARRAGRYRSVAYWGSAALLVAVLVAITNLDLTGVQQLNLWFHYSQGNAW